MTDLQQVHRYAAGALMTLALQQAQIHQISSPYHPDSLDIDTKYGSYDIEDGEPSDALWTSEQLGLLRPVFRYLKIETKAWSGLEKMALSTDAKFHIGAFLRTVLEDIDNVAPPDDHLTEAIETIALKICGPSNSFSHSKEPQGQSDEINVEANPGEAPSSDFTQFHVNNVNPEGITVSCNSTQEFPLLREDYFAYCPVTRIRSTPETCQKENEHDSSDMEDLVMENLLGKQISINEVAHDSESSSINDNLITHLRSYKERRKIAVLYELLSAAVADIPSEEGETESRARWGYDARHRVALRLLATWLDVKWTKMAAMEVLVSYAAIARREGKEEDISNETKSWAKWKRGGLIGAAALTGGALLAVTAGLAAPAIAAGLSALAPTLGTIIPAIGSTGFAAAAAAAGSTIGSVAVAASFGAAGAGLTGFKMARRTGGIEEFGFEGLGENHQQGRLGVGIMVSGFLNDVDDFSKPWKGYGHDLEMYAVRWGKKILMSISTAIQDWLASSIASELMKQGAMLTVLGTLLSALTWPSTLLSLTDLIDSRWAVAVDRSDKAGKLLADVLLKGLQGSRPVTLIGFSLGARVIFKCLEKLAKKGDTGRIVERVVLLGAPVSIENHRWQAVRKVVAGRFVNVYSTNDWLLAIVYRASLLSQGLAGIQPVNVPGIENVDVTEKINGHSLYLTKVGEILVSLDMDSYFPCVPRK